MSTIIDDLRFSLRSFWRNPGFALVVVAVLALGIGANTSIFSVVNGVLLQPLPLSQPERLVMIYASFPSAKEAWVSYPDFRHWSRENHSFADVAAFGGNWAFNLSGSDRQRARLTGPTGGRRRRRSAFIRPAQRIPLLT